MNKNLFDMKPKEFIAQHAIAVDYNNGTTTPMLSISNAHKAVALAEYNLATELLKSMRTQELSF
jgi:hypothetical protein